MSLEGTGRQGLNGLFELGHGHQEGVMADRGTLLLQRHLGENIVLVNLCGACWVVKAVAPWLGMSHSRALPHLDGGDSVQLGQVVLDVDHAGAAVHPRHREAAQRRVNEDLRLPRRRRQGRRVGGGAQQPLHLAGRKLQGAGLGLDDGLEAHQSDLADDVVHGDEVGQVEDGSLLRLQGH